QAAEEAARLHERERIARELHDSVAQQLFRLGIELRRVAESDDGTARELEEARQLLADASGRLRRAVREELPGPGRERLADELRALCSAFEVRTGIRCTCRPALPSEPPSPLA